MDELLVETLRDAQRFGFFGSRPIEEAIEHSQQFVDAIGRLDDGSRIADLGSGGGLPGLVLAASYPDASLTLIDRREKRTDFLRRAVRRLGWDHVTVISADVAQLIRDRPKRLLSFDIVTARGFGPPEDTLRAGLALIGPAGRVVISEPPTDDRWDPSLLDELDVRRERVGAVSVFHRR